MELKIDKIFDAYALLLHCMFNAMEIININTKLFFWWFALQEKPLAVYCSRHVHIYSQGSPSPLSLSVSLARALIPVSRLECARSGLFARCTQTDKAKHAQKQHNLNIFFCVIFYFYLKSKTNPKITHTTRNYLPLKNQMRCVSLAHGNKFVWIQFSAVSKKNIVFFLSSNASMRFCFVPPYRRVCCHHQMRIRWMEWRECSRREINRKEIHLTRLVWAHRLSRTCK